MSGKTPQAQAQEEGPFREEGPFMDAQEEGPFGDDEPVLVLGQDTVDADMQWWWWTGRIGAFLCYGMIFFVILVIIFAMMVTIGIWAVSELDAVAEVYSVDCEGARCKKITYRDAVYKLPPCSRMSAARCAMIPIHWVFVPMLPVYQWMVGKSMFEIHEHLPLLLEQRCKLCYGVSFTQ